MFTHIVMETDQALMKFCGDYGILVDQIHGYEKDGIGRLTFAVPFPESHFIPSVGKIVKDETFLETVRKRLEEIGYQVSADDLTWSVAKTFNREILCSFYYLILFSPDQKGAIEAARRLNNPPDGAMETKEDLVAIPTNLLLYLYVKIDVSDLIQNYQRKKVLELEEQYGITKLWEKEQ